MNQTAFSEQRQKLFEKTLVVQRPFKHIFCSKDCFCSREFVSSKIGAHYLNSQPHFPKKNTKTQNLICFLFLGVWDTAILNKKKV